MRKKIMILLLGCLLFTGCDRLSTPETTTEVTLKQYDTLSEAQKICGFSIDVSKHLEDAFSKKQFAVEDGKLQITFQRKGIQKAVLTKQTEDAFPSDKPQKTLQIGGKSVSFYSNNIMIWKNEYFFYSLQFFNCDFSDLQIYDMIDETDMCIEEDNVTYSEDSFKQDFPNAVVSRNDDKTTITHINVDHEILTSREAKQIIQSFSSILGIQSADTEVVFNTYKEDAYYFVQYNGSLPVENGYFVLKQDEDISIQAHYQKVYNLDKTSRITQQKAMDISKAYGSVKKMDKCIYCYNDCSEIAYKIFLTNGNVLFISAKTGNILGR